MLVIYGPTSTGKTKLGISLAKEFNGEVISADSRQVYRGLDIGTGKVSFESKVEKHPKYWNVDGIKVYGFDLINPGENFSAADFIKFASDSMTQIMEQKKLPIIVGGTGFYIYAFLNGIGSIGIPKDQKLRSNLEKLTKVQLAQKLSRLDPKRANSLNQSDRQNPRRLIRAIEIAIGRKKITIPKNLSKNVPPADSLSIGLTAPNGFIYRQADKWTDQRFDKICEEIKYLISSGINQKWLENLGLEYRWVLRFLQKKVSKEESIIKLKNDTHSFIRRQKTWFKKFNGMQLFDITDRAWQSKLEKTISVWYDQPSG